MSRDEQRKMWDAAAKREKADRKAQIKRAKIMKAQHKRDLAAARARAKASAKRRWRSG